MNWVSRLLAGWLDDANPRRGSTIRPQVEELECRWVPSSVAQSTSTNWAGYAVSTSSSHEVTSVSGSWVVPTVTGSGSGATYSSAWVGIDGFHSNSVEQTGTEMDVSRGVATYSAWWEMYPNAPVTISSITVHPGDTITASVTYNPTANNFTLKLTDGKESFTTTQSAPAGAQENSAEWIAEAPYSGGVLPLANFGTMTFSDAQATINGVSGAIDASPAAWQAVGATANQINLSNSRSQATTSALTDSGTPLTSAFSVAYGSTAPAAPGSPTPPSNPTSPPTTPPTTPPPTTPSTTVATTTTLTGTVNPTFWFQPPSVTFTITVAAASGQALPTGTVQLMYNGQVLGTATIKDVNGVATATFTVEFFGAGSYNFTANYLGSSQFQGSTSNSVGVTVT